MRRSTGVYGRTSHLTQFGRRALWGHMFLRLCAYDARDWSFFFIQTYRKYDDEQPNFLSFGHDASL